MAATAQPLRFVARAVTEWERASAVSAACVVGFVALGVRVACQDMTLCVYTTSRGDETV